MLFEGYVDVIKAWEAGITNGVATMGTALTPEHAEAIRRLAERVIVAYDGDAPDKPPRTRAFRFWRMPDAAPRWLSFRMRRIRMSTLRLTVLNDSYGRLSRPPYRRSNINFFTFAKIINCRRMERGSGTSSRRSS
ncbi:toprim domain-containing protein [Paenibacillus sp. P25]|nr:toprim domain-containing protein [Paenibacillus sp. P25]